MTTTARDALSLAQLDALLTEKLFGWNWYTLTPDGIATALTQTDGVDRSHLIPTDGRSAPRFLAEPQSGQVQVDAGRFRLATGNEPIAAGNERHVLPISVNLGLAVFALQKCGYVQYVKQVGHVNGTGESHRIRCSRDMAPHCPMGSAEAPTFSEAVVRAVAIAFELAP